MAERIIYDKPFRDRLILARSLGISEKRLLGWEPRETHERAAERTIVTREAEWDDMERAKMLALAEYEADLCSCGFPKSIADDDPHLQVKYRVCPVCAGVAKAIRVQNAADTEEVRRLGEKPSPDADLPTDGRYFGLESASLPEDSERPA